MGFGSYTVSKVAGSHSRRHVRRATPNPSCTTGGFYQAPTNQQSVDSLQPLTVKWDNTCLTTTNADIYLYAPHADRTRIAVWENVPFGPGTVTVDLMPRWWNSTSSINLQLNIVPAGQAPFQTYNIPAGPVFTATYTQPSSGNTPPAADTSIKTSPVMDMSQLNKPRGLTPGQKAAAVLLPLLFIIGAAVAYIRWQRKKAEDKTKRFSVAIDKRMSTISTDWKSVTAAGANAAIRNSMAVPGNRTSSFSFGNIRPTSIAIDDNQAGIGGGRQMSQLRTGVGLRNPSGSLPSERVSRVSFADTVNNRQSRVSFANDPRPSVDSSSTTRRTRAFHNDYIPPVPSLPPTAITTNTSSSPLSPNSDDGSPDSSVAALSPRQTQGPLTLTPEDIRARISANSRIRSISNASSSVPPTPKKDDIEDVIPALSMMRTDQGEEFLIPSPPPPTSPPPRMMSPTMPTMPMPASVMSPDEMLRAYAERKKNAKRISSAKISYPIPMSPSTGGMMTSPTIMSGGLALPMSPPPALSPQSAAARQLFGPTGVVGQGQGQGHGYNGPVGQYAGARYEIGDEEDAYGGTV